MDFATITDQVGSILKSAGRTGGNTKAYVDIPTVDAQREVIVSHLKSNYGTQTSEMLNAKAFVDTANVQRNLLRSTEGEIQKLNSHASSLETKVHTREADLKLSSGRTLILQVLGATIAIVVAVYSVFGSLEYVHAVALSCLAAGFGYALYLRGNPEADIFKPTGADDGKTL